MTGFIARVADRIAGFGDQAGRDPAGRDQLGCDQTGLEPAHAGALLARLRHLVARFRAVAVTPIPPPKPEPKPAEPKFVPTHSFRDVSVDPQAEPTPEPTPEPIRLPRSWRWLSRLVPQAEAERAQLEALLRDPATQERLAADPRLGRILRPLGWMLGVDRALLPPSGWRRRQLVVVPGGHAEAAAAVEEYAAARAKGATAAEVLARCCVWIPNKWDCGWDRPRDSQWATGPDTRPGRRRDSWLVWRGCAGPVLPGLARFSA
ncbi:MAG: hypothetical protein B7X09_05970 [Acidiphilium sp. 21-66-27]|nr:MAG: hypothetical protein B7X09_05970 [Acidiphilium sp. 21-66-27]